MSSTGNSLTGIVQSGAMGYGLNGRDSIPSRAKGFLSSPHLPDRFWDSLSLLSESADISSHFNTPGKTNCSSQFFLYAAVFYLIIGTSPNAIVKHNYKKRYIAKDMFQSLGSTNTDRYSLAARLKKTAVST
jgi:hypothetical protein